MRKRSKYRPRLRQVNPLGMVLERLSPARSHTDEMLKVKIKNHGALAALMRGQANKQDLDILIATNNITHALHRLGYGEGYEEVLRDGHNALLDVSRRYASTGRAVLYAHEINALNLLMELHDAQMDVITMHDMEKALVIVHKDLIAGRFEPIRRKELA